MSNGIGESGGLAEGVDDASSALADGSGGDEPGSVETDPAASLDEESGDVDSEAVGTVMSVVSSAASASRSGGLLGMLIRQHRLKPELVATQTLTLLLRDPAARAGLDALCAKIRPQLPPVDRWQAEVVDNEDRSRADLVGFSGTDPVVVVEAKFWAPLQPTQPLAYLRRLGAAPRRLLLFVTPAVRLDTLWPQVLDRLAAEFDTPGYGGQPIGRGTHSQPLPSGQVVAITSWESLLEACAAGTGAGDWQALRDLAAWQDVAALPPLSDDDLPPAVGTQLYRLLGVLRAVAKEMSKHEWTVTVSSGANYFGHLGTSPAGHRVWFGLWLREWHAGGHPVWVQSPSRCAPTDKSAVVRAWKTSQLPLNGWLREGTQGPRVPLELTRHAEEHLVRSGLVEQLLTAADALHGLPSD